MMNVYEYEAKRCLGIAEQIDEQVPRGERSADEAERDLIALVTVVSAYKTYTPITPEEWRHAGRLAGWWPVWWTEGPVGAISAGNDQRKGSRSDS